MAWLFSCFRCKRRQQCQSSSRHANYKIAVENAVPRNANVLKTQDVLQEERVHTCVSLEQSLDASQQGNDVERSLLSFLITETTKEQSSADNPLRKEGLQQVIEEFRRVKDLKNEETDLQDLLHPLRRAFDDLHEDSEEGQVEKGRHTKIEGQGETLVMDKLVLQKQNKLDSDKRVDIGEPLLSSFKNESQLCDIEASKELCNFASSFSPATEKESRFSLDEETDWTSPEKSLLERRFHNWRGCSSETKVKQSDQRRDDSFESTPQNIEEPLVISRLKRSSKALSFSEFSLGLQDFKRTESSVTRTIGINRTTALGGETDDEITANLFTNLPGSLPMSSEQAVSLSVSEDVTLYDTDMEVDSKAVTPYSNENSVDRPPGYVRTFKYNAHEVSLCADLTMDQSQAFTFEDSYNENIEVSRFFTECNSKRKVLDEGVEELDIDQMSNCSDASSFLTSPLPQTLSESDEVFARRRADLHAIIRAFPMPQEITAESSADCGKSRFHRELSFASSQTAGGWMKMQSHESLNLDTQMSLEGTNSNDIDQPEEGRHLSANIADLVSGYKLLPSNLSGNDTSRPSRQSIDLSPESCTYSGIDYMKAITSDEFASLEAASFSVPSPETVTSMIHMQSPSLLSNAKETSSTGRIMLNLAQETSSVSKSALEISSANFIKQQPTPRTPSTSSSQVETPNSIQSVVSPADLAKDRPIMGTVAAHWSHSSSKEKWWDGKGIPNSTNKYKEDQKVSWHATPFEVRLERALAKQGRVFQKKLFGGAMPTEMELRTEPITSSG